MAEDLGIKVKVVPDTNELKKSLDKSKLDIKVNLVPDMKVLDAALNKFKNGLKINLDIGGATDIGNISSAFGKLENRISKVNDAASKSKLASEFDSLKKSYDALLQSGDISNIDYSQMQQGLARVKAECDDVIQAQNKMAAAQEKAARQAEKASSKQAQALQHQISMANDAYASLMRNRPSAPSGYGSLLDTTLYDNVNTAYAGVESARTAFNNNGSAASLNVYNAAIQKAEAALRSYSAAVTRADSVTENAFASMSKMASDLNARLNSLKTGYSGSLKKDSGIEDTIRQAETALKTLRELSSGAANGNMNYQQVDDLLNQMSGAAEKAGTPITNLSSMMDVLRTNISDAQTAIRNFNKEVKEPQSIESLQKRLNNLIYTLDRYVDANQKIQSNSELNLGFGNLRENMVSAVRSADIDTMNKSLSESANRMAELKTRAQELGLEGKTLGQTFQNLFGEHFSTAIAMGALHLMQDSLHQIYQNVLDIDTAMTELKKVTDETGATYDAFMDRSADTAKKLGADLGDLINTTADWARLGYDIGDAEELARVSTLYKNVGDSIDSAGQASEYLISTLKGFDLDASAAEHVLDAINAVSNTEPVSAQDLGEIMKRSSAAMSAANNTMEETIALGTAMNSVLQDADRAGTTLKTVSMYLRSTKTELEAAGESTEGMAESTSKLREQLMALTHGKVDIMLNEDTYKSTYQIIKEMSEAWDTMTDKEHAAALELMGGKRNANAVQAMIQQFQIAEDALAAAQNSAGSAMRENDKYMNSIQGKLTKFQSTFEVFSTDLLDSDLVKFFIDTGTGAVEAADGITKFAGAIPMATMAFSAFLRATNTKTNGNEEDVRLRGGDSRVGCAVDLLYKCPNCWEKLKPYHHSILVTVCDGVERQKEWYGCDMLREKPNTGAKSQCNAQSAA